VIAHVVEQKPIPLEEITQQRQQAEQETTRERRESAREPVSGRRDPRGAFSRQPADGDEERRCDRRIGQLSADGQGQAEAGERRAEGFDPRPFG